MEAVVLRLEAVVLRLEAITLRLEAIARRLEAHARIIFYSPRVSSSFQSRVLACGLEVGPPAPDGTLSALELELHFEDCLVIH